MRTQVSIRMTDLIKEANDVQTQPEGELLYHLFPEKCEFQT